MLRSWTKQELERVKELWLSGLSAQQVADLTGKTRGAVVGKMKRLKLLRKDTGKETVVIKKPKTVKRPASPKPLPVPAPAPAQVVKHSEHPVILADLKPHHCRAILGDVGKDGFAFYCADPKAVGSSYCAHHTGRFTQPLKERLHYGQAGQRIQPVRR